MRYKIFALLGLLVLAGCTKRDRLNPLDPENPDTRGRPQPPALISIQDTVEISWYPYAFDDLDSIRIFRKVDGEGDYRLLQTVSPHQRQIRDFPVDFETTHWYRISLTAGEYESFRSEPAGIRPGPTFLWAADIERGQIVRYTHDGAHEVFRTQPLFLEPIDIELDTLNQAIWVADALASELVRIDYSGRIALSISRLRRIYHLRLDPADQSILVLSRLDSTLTRFSFQGQELMRVTGLNRPVALRINPVDRSLFVLEKSRRRIVQLDAAGESLQVISGLLAPYDLALDSRSNLLWVADSSRLVRVDLNDDSREIFTGFGLAYRVEVDEQTGACWLIDWSSAPEESRVICLDRQGNELFRRGGFTDPRRLEINPYNRHGFVAETLARRLTELSPAGEVLSRIATAGGLIDLQVEPARQ